MLVSLSDRSIEPEIPVGALWALGGALLYAMYLVLLRRRVDNEDKLNIPMFFGKFTAVFIRNILWKSGSMQIVGRRDSTSRKV